MGASRQLPFVGQAAKVSFFGGEVLAATVVEVTASGRGVSVETAAGERLRFTLNGATAHFVLDGDPHGPRLDLVG